MSKSAFAYVNQRDESDGIGMRFYTLECRWDKQEWNATYPILRIFIRLAIHPTKELRYAMLIDAEDVTASQPLDD